MQTAVLFITDPDLGQVKRVRTRSQPMKPEISTIANRALQISGSMLLMLFLVMLPRYTDTAKTWFVLLILMALAYFIFNLGQLRDSSFSMRLFFTALLLNFLWITFCYYANGEPGRGASFVWGRHFYVLFMIPMYFLFRKIDLPERVLLPTLFISVTLSLTDILIDLAQGIDHRLQGMNPNAFGPVQLCLSGMLLFFFLERRGNPLRWLALAGAANGLSTVIFSKSRSTWLTLAVLSFFFIFYLTRSLSPWRRIGAFTMLILLFSACYQLPIVKKRIDYGLTTVDAYFASEDYRDDSRLGSFGTRMELWKTGWYIFLENPMLGVGVGGFNPMAKANSERYRINDVVHQFKYVHNQYIAALATRGVPGLILFLLVMLMPVYIALSANPHGNEVHFHRLSLVFICMVYLVGCFSEDHFEAKSAIMFSGVMLPFLLARIDTNRASTKPESSP